MTKAITIMIATTMIRFHAENIVCDVGIDCVTAPAVCLFISSVYEASCSGIEPEKPACQITKPEYADAISSL